MTFTQREWRRAITCAFWLALLLSSPVHAGLKERIAALAPGEVVLVVDAKGAELVSQKANEPFVPASVAKVVTAYLAMELLGPDHRFETRFYLDSTRVLYIKGAGDPFLVSEELAALGSALVSAVGKQPLTGIVVDASYFPSNLRIPGIELTGEAYDAVNSALAANFNTIHAVRKGKTVETGEAQTPITPLAINQYAARGPNGRGRISLSQDSAIALQYAGELIAAFIERAGGKVGGRITLGTVPAGLQPVYVHRQSRTLPAIISEMLRGSNNFVANQIFLEIGARQLGAPVSLEKSLRVANEFLDKRGLAGAIKLEEGSGISRGNRLTAQALVQVLQWFEPNASLLRHGEGALFKTGTFSGVRTLAGYADTSKHGRVRFVIALRSNDSTLRFKILKAIQSEL